MSGFFKVNFDLWTHLYLPPCTSQQLQTFTYSLVADYIIIWCHDHAEITFITCTSQSTFAAECLRIYCVNLDILQYNQNARYYHDFVLSAIAENTACMQNTCIVAIANSWASGLTVSSAWKIAKFPGNGDCDTTATALLELLLSPHAVESSTKGKGWSSRSHCTIAPSVALTMQVSVAFSPNRSVALDGNSRNTVCSKEQRVYAQKLQTCISFSFAAADMYHGLCEIRR